MQEMKRVDDTSGPMAWFDDRPSDEAMTGFDAIGWAASTWVLHAMYENVDLTGLGTHDDLHRRRLDAGEIAPLVIGGVNIEASITVTGCALGFVARPGQPWVRLTWAEYLHRFPDFSPSHDFPPCMRWFPPGSWPAAIEPPPEGSLDGESLEALIAILAAHSREGQDTPCFAFYGSLAAGDFDNAHLWRGPLSHIPDLINVNGGPYAFSPTNFWPDEREWFVWTDYDLEATKISGDPALVSALQADPRLECERWRASEPT